MSVIALRTDKCFDQVKAWVEKLELTGFAVREVAGGTNEHWHWLLEDSRSRKLNAMRVNFVRAVPECSGNGAYSLSECRDVEKYERYLCKGESEGAGPEVAWSYGLKYNDEKLEALHTEYWQANRNLRKRRATSVMDYVIDESKRRNLNWKDREDIAEVYIRELAARSKPINTFAIKAAVNAVQVALCPDDAAIKLFASLV